MKLSAPPSQIVRRIIGSKVNNVVDVPGSPHLAANQAAHKISPQPLGMPTELQSMFAKPSSNAIEQGPLDAGDQGVSESEAVNADRLQQELLRFPSTAMVATYRDNAYVLQSASAELQFKRYREPDGSYRFAITKSTGALPIASVDPRALGTLDSEIAAAGGPKLPVTLPNNSLPDFARRISQMFDHEDSPDFVRIAQPDASPDTSVPNYPGGNHGGPDILQSRAPLIIAGPGLDAGVVSNQLVRSIDVAPTIAAGIGIGQLQSQDGSSLLDSMNAGKASQALMFIFDGTNANVFHDELAKGNLPNIAKLAERGTTFSNGTIAEMPTQTWANHATLVTGASPGRHGIIGNGWYDREAKVERHTVDAGNTNLFWSSQLLDKRAETLYEGVHRTFGPKALTAAINEPQGRGADIATLDIAGVGKIMRKAPSVLVNLHNGKKLRDKQYQGDGAYQQASKLDNFGISILQSLYRKPGNQPKLAVVEQFLTDNMGHAHGAQAEQTRAALAETDRNIGRVLDTLQRSGKLGETMVVVTSDHGNEHQLNVGDGDVETALKNSGVDAIAIENQFWLRDN